MDPNREIAWNEYEKVYLLAEILKAAPIPSHVLLNLIRDHQIQPRWTEMALPPGRSLRSSQMAFDTMNGNYTGTDYRRAPMPTAGAHPIMYTGPEASKKRPFQETATPIGRLLQPRPPQTYGGEYMQPGGPAYTSTMASAGEPANKKKRGRPTKAEAQQRAQEAAARGEVYPPPRRGRASITAPSEPSPLGSESRLLERTPPQQPRGQLNPVMTPQHQMQPERESESSSGKRRRTKPQPLELEKPQRAMGEMGSPLAFGSGDTSRSQQYSSYTPISAPLPSSTDSRDRDIRMEGVEESQPRTTTPHSFKDTVGI
ncbi:hypothetical protein FB567DRAFT_439752 [Paraphoma chrysanthemicola]|uniref:Uncharacterized protein n=1 Tax=Paraphoma chrysanthemicola TaxID=798071 RepID=A0A8K0W1C2_9PLEO|nr:hypothetical protein FB567DRAFT_439752 [Paraphoma chrysanthemicola]